MAKSERLVIRLAAEDRDWIRAEAERIGVDSATLVRMLIRQARTMEHVPEGVGAIREAVGESPGPHAASFDHIGDAPAEPPIDDINEGNLEALMQAAPSLLDEAAEIEESDTSYPPPRHLPPAIAQGAQYRFQRMPQRAQQQLQPAIPPRGGYQATPAFGAGTLTRAVGVGTGGHGNVLGDGVGNVIRDNFGHLGFVGTRSR